MDRLKLFVKGKGEITLTPNEFINAGGEINFTRMFGEFF